MGDAELAQLREELERERQETERFKLRAQDNQRRVQELRRMIHHSPEDQYGSREDRSPMPHKHHFPEDQYGSREDRSPVPHKHHFPKDQYGSRENRSPMPHKRLREDRELSSDRERRSPHSRERQSPSSQERHRDDNDYDRQRESYNRDRQKNDYDYDKDRRRDKYDRDGYRDDYDRDKHRDDYDRDRRSYVGYEREGSRDRDHRRSSAEGEAQERRVVRLEVERRTVRVETNSRRSSERRPASPERNPSLAAEPRSLSSPGWTNQLSSQGSLVSPGSGFPMMSPVVLPYMGSPPGYVTYQGVAPVPPPSQPATMLGQAFNPFLLAGCPPPGFPGWNPALPPPAMPNIPASNPPAIRHQPPRRTSLREIPTVDEPRPPGVDSSNSAGPISCSLSTYDADNVLSVMKPSVEESRKQEACKIPGLDFVNDDDTGASSHNSQNFWQLSSVGSSDATDHQTDTATDHQTDTATDHQTDTAASTPNNAPADQATTSPDAGQPAGQASGKNPDGIAKKNQEAKKKVKAESVEVSFVAGMMCPVAACQMPSFFYHDLSPFVLHWMITHEQLMDMYACHACSQHVLQWEGSLMHHLADKHGISGDESLIATYNYGLVKKKINTNFINPEGYKFDIAKGLQEIASQVLAKGKSHKNNTSFLKRGVLHGDIMKKPVLFRKNMTCPVPGCSSSSPFDILDDFIEHWNNVHQRECPYFVCLICRADPMGSRQTAVKKLSAMHKHFMKEHPMHRFMLVTVPPGTNPKIPQVCYEMHLNASYIEPNGFQFILGDKKHSSIASNLKSQCKCNNAEPIPIVAGNRRRTVSEKSDGGDHREEFQVVDFAPGMTCPVPRCSQGSNRWYKAHDFSWHWTLRHKPSQHRQCYLCLYSFPVLAQPASFSKECQKHYEVRHPEVARYWTTGFSSTMKAAEDPGNLRH